MGGVSYVKRYELNGKWYTIKELSDISGLLAHTIRDRLRRGYTVEEAIKIMATDDSIKEFCEASYYLDWIGMPISDLYEIYWKWCVSYGYTPTSKQKFSRHLLQILPMMKTVPTRNGETYQRIIRMREL